MVIEETVNANERRERALMRKASHLSDLGTLTSLGASGLYFVESLAVKEKMPKSVFALSVAGVVVGIGAVISSVFYRQKAGKIAHANEQLLSRELQDYQRGR